MRMIPRGGNYFSGKKMLTLENVGSLILTHQCSRYSHHLFVKVLFELGRSVKMFFDVTLSDQSTLINK